MSAEYTWAVDAVKDISDEHLSSGPERGMGRHCRALAIRHGPRRAEFREADGPGMRGMPRELARADERRSPVQAGRVHTDTAPKRRGASAVVVRQGQPAARRAAGRV